MADFDSVSKRFSGMQLGEGPETILPAPDGAFDQGDRQHLLGLYSGIAAAGAASALPWLYRNHTFTLGAGFVRGL